MPRLSAGWLVFFGLLALHCNLANAQQTKARKEVEQAFNSGKMVVLVVAPQKHAGEEDESETYGDWADNLNGFASSLPADTKIVKLTAAQYKQDLEEPKIRRAYATVFLRDATHALLYDGMIVEAMAYKVGLAWLHQQPDEKAMSAYGLQEKPAKLCRSGETAPAKAPSR